jgi:acyl carrier protein
MTREAINQLVLDTFKQVIRDSEKTFAKDPDTNTAIMGTDSPFDSVDLVTFIVALEQALEDDHNISITLADDRALGQAVSPFKNIGTISDYIEQLVNEN